MAKRKTGDKPKSLSERLKAKSAAAERTSAVEADERVKLLMREVGTLKKQLSGYTTRDALIMAAVKDAFQAPPCLTLRAPPKAGKSKAVEHALLHLTDLHIGKLTPTFDAATARTRLRQAVAATSEITNLRRQTARIDRVYLALGGDCVEGEEIYPGQSHDIEGDLFWQTREASEAIAEIILSLLQEFPEVYVFAVEGNHGKNGYRGSKATNWDSIAYYSARMMVESAAKKDAKRITWDIPHERDERWYSIARIMGWGVMLIHGDQLKGGSLGFPWYSSQKKALGWTDTVGQGVDAILAGHWHVEAKQTVGKRTMLACGSIESTNIYARESFAGVDDPHQKLYFWNQGHGLLSDCKLYLGDRKPNR